MYHFAVVALLALGVIKLVDFLTDLIPSRRELPAIRTVLTFAAGFGAVWMLDYSVFTGWGIDVRNHAVAVWMTGFLIAGATVPWRAAFRWLTHDASTIDEPLGEHMRLRKAA